MFEVDVLLARRNMHVRQAEPMCGTSRAPGARRTAKTRILVAFRIHSPFILTEGHGNVR